jgi:hypothetical protein
VNEIVPFLGGLLIGLLYRRGNLSRIWAATAALAVAIIATIISGEFLISWAFLLIDVPIVLVSAAIGYLAWTVVEARRTRDTGTE